MYAWPWNGSAWCSQSEKNGVEVHAERLEDLGRVTLELLPLLRRDLAGLDLLPLGGLFRVESESRH